MLCTHPRQRKSNDLYGEEEKISFINSRVVGVGLKKEYGGTLGKKAQEDTQLSLNGNLIELNSCIDILIMLESYFIVLYSQYLAAI